MLVTAVVVLVLFASACGSRSHQPVYNGKPLSEWLSELTEDQNNPDDTRDQAQEAIREIGTNALPFLLDETRFLGTAWEADTTNFFSKPGMADRVTDLRSAFEVLGPVAKPSFTDLVNLMNDGGLSAGIAAFALTQIDPQAAAMALTQALTNKIISVRVAAAENLFCVGSNAAIAVPNLIQCLKVNSPDDSGSGILKSTAARRLGEIQAYPDLAVPALIEALSDKEALVRFESARALAKFGSAAISAVPALKQATDDLDRNVRAGASYALKQIQSPSP